VRRVAGQRLVHVHSREQPGPGFEPAEPDLEDVYFHALASDAANAAAPAPTAPSSLQGAVAS